jgi:hypothetical protein
MDALPSSPRLVWGGVHPVNTGITLELTPGNGDAASSASVRNMVGALLETAAPPINYIIWAGRLFLIMLALGFGNGGPHFDPPGAYSLLWPNNMTFPPTLSSILVEGLLAAASHWFLS